jgi:hypothetical protein
VSIAQFKADFHISTYGAAPDPNRGSAYDPNSASYEYTNCYTFAAQLPGAFDQGANAPGKRANSSLDYNTALDVYIIADYVIADMEQEGRSARLLSSYTSLIRSDEYRIVLRVTSQPPYDYHFMVQSSDGSWTEQRSQTGSIYNYPAIYNPADAPWGRKVKNDPLKYDSGIIHLAISAPGRR